MRGASSLVVLLLVLSTAVAKLAHLAEEALSLFDDGCCGVEGCELSLMQLQATRWRHAAGSAPAAQISSAALRPSRRQEPGAAGSAEHLEEVVEAAEAEAEADILKDKLKEAEEEVEKEEEQLKEEEAAADVAKLQDRLQEAHLKATVEELKAKFAEEEDKVKVDELSGEAKKAEEDVLEEKLEDADSTAEANGLEDELKKSEQAAIVDAGGAAKELQDDEATVDELKQQLAAAEAELKKLTLQDKLKESAEEEKEHKMEAVVDEAEAAEKTEKLKDRMKELEEEEADKKLESEAKQAEAADSVEKLTDNLKDADAAAEKATEELMAPSVVARQGAGDSVRTALGEVEAKVREEADSESEKNAGSSEVSVRTALGEVEAKVGEEFGKESEANAGSSGVSVGQALGEVEAKVGEEAGKTSGANAGSSGFVEPVAGVAFSGFRFGAGVMLCFCAVALLIRICGGDFAGYSHVHTESATMHNYELGMFQLAALVCEILGMSSFTYLVPESYNLAQTFGFGAAESGLLIGSYMAIGGVAPPVLKIMMQRCSAHSTKLLAVTSIGAHALCFVTFALAANPPAMMHTATPSQRFGCLIATRFLMGIYWNIGQTYLDIIATQITPSSQMIRFQILRTIAMTVGVGGGPLLSSIAVQASGTVGAAARSALISYAFVVPWFALTVATMLLPADISHLLKAKVAVDATSGSDASVAEDPAMILSQADRRAVWIKGLAYNGERAFISASLEAATALVLEAEFGWSTESIGLAVGGTFLASVPLTLMAEAARLRGWVTDLQLMCLSTCIGTMAAALFFPSIGRVMGAGARAGVGLILVADCLVFSCGYMANGIMDGLCVKYSIPGSLHSCENYIAARSATTTFARFLGPPVARFVLGAGGRGSYAGCQMAFTALGCATSLSVASVMRHRG